MAKVQRRRCATIEGTRKVPSLHSPLPAPQDALRLLKSEECTNLGEAARALGYSWPQCHRWFASYKKGALQELLKSRVGERGRQELVTEEAFADLQEAMKRGEIATISEAEEFLREHHGIEYAHPDGVGQLLRRRKVKKKTGRPRHEEADQKEQEAFKKSSLLRSSGRALATTNR
jgi:transposase